MDKRNKLPYAHLATNTKKSQVLVIGEKVCCLNSTHWRMLRKRQILDYNVEQTDLRQFSWKERRGRLILLLCLPVTSYANFLTVMNLSILICTMEIGLPILQCCAWCITGTHWLLVSFCSTPPGMNLEGDMENQRKKLNKDSGPQQ